jgi:transcriptional regulator with XRE-family HTH domain
MRLGSLAEAAGLSAPFVSLVERGKRDPSLVALRRLADALKVPVEAFVLLGQAPDGRLQTSDARARRLADSIRRLAGAEERLRRRLTEHGGTHEAARSST